jgi:uncharacterized protein (TIGR02996 family)
MAKKRATSPDEAFLADICANPDDDAPRLVYADWLDDHDQPHRAEFIRVQCQLARLGMNDPQRDELEWRAWELLTVHRQEWFSSLPALARKKKAATFRRGFVERLSLTAKEFLRQGKTLFAAMPLRGVHLRTLGRHVESLVACPLLARLSALDLGHNTQGIDVGVGAVVALVGSPHLTGLTELGLSRTLVDENDFRQLAAWPGLARITSLDLRDNRLSPDSLRILLSSDHLTSLTSLNLAANNALGLAACQALAASPRLASLKHLDLSWCDLREVPMWESRGEPSVEVLSASPHLSALTSLDLSVTGLHSEDAEALASGRFTSLTALRLDTNGINATGARALAQSPGLASLRSLRLYYNGIGSEGARALAESPYLHNLTILDLGLNHIDNDGAIALAESPHLAQLRELRLRGNDISEEGVRALASSPYLANLRTLTLSANNLDSKAVQAIASSPYLGQLRKLAISGKRQLSAKAYALLAESPCLPRLVVLSTTPRANEDVLIRRTDHPA